MPLLPITGEQFNSSLAFNNNNTHHHHPQWSIPSVPAAVAEDPANVPELLSTNGPITCGTFCQSSIRHSPPSTTIIIIIISSTIVAEVFLLHLFLLAVSPKIEIGDPLAATTVYRAVDGKNVPIKLDHWASSIEGTKGGN